MGALEAEIQHNPRDTSEEKSQNFVAAQTVLVESLREDIARLTNENKKLKGEFNADSYFK